MNDQLLGVLWQSHARRATRLCFDRKAKARALARTLFDAAWYLEKNPDVKAKGRDPLKHFLRHGWHEGREPAPWFDSDAYKRANPDVTGNAFLHYLRHGIAEGRPLVPVKRKSMPITLPLPVRARHKRLAVYTAIAGGYEPLKWPEVIGESVDYICYTDQEILAPGIWQLRPLPFWDHEPTRAARYVKLNPHLLLPDYEWSLWVDGSMQLNCDPQAFIDEARLIAMYPHHERDCGYDEAEMTAFLGLDDKAVIERQAQRYRDRGMPAHLGLFETGVIARRHMDPDVIAFDRLWWAELQAGSRRDQVALPYVMWKTGTPVTRLAPKGITVRNDKRVAYYKHKAKYKPSAAAIEALRLAARERMNGTGEMPRVIASGHYSVDVIVCVKDALEAVRACIDSVTAALDRGARLIVIDDGSGPETRDFLDWRLQGDRHRVVHLPENLGYTRAANVGLKLSTGNFAVLLNSDTRVAQGWLAALVTACESAADVGFAGPLSNAATWQSVPEIVAETGFAVNDLPDRLTLAETNKLLASWRLGPVKVPLVNGFCLMIKRSALESVGLLDEDSYPWGYNEETDWMLRAHEQGWIGAVATDCYVWHEKSQSFGDERRKQLAAEGYPKLMARHGREKIMRVVATMKHQPMLGLIRQRVREWQGATLGLLLALVLT